MRFKILCLVFLFTQVVCAQQDFEAFLQSVERNNFQLASGTALTDAKILEANTGIFLPTPEISYDYLVGSTESFSEVVISQPFDFPSTYLHRKKIAKLGVEKSNHEYKRLRLSLLTRAAQIYARQIGFNRRLILHTEIQQLVSQLSLNAERKFEVGETNILEVNRMRAEVSLSNLDYQKLKADQVALAIKISELNGNKTFSITDTSNYNILSKIEPEILIQEILSRHPQEKYWQSELQISEQDIRLKKAESLPGFEIGYRQEMISKSVSRGIAAGMTIPLFENKNTVKLAKAKQAYLEQEYKSEQLSVKNSLRSMIQVLTITQASVTELEIILNTLSTPELLRKAFEKGEIDYTVFFSEYKNYIQLRLEYEELREKALALELEFYVLLNS